MAAKGRRRTEWVGAVGALAGSAGTLETVILSTADVEAPRTLIRVIGQISTTFSRSAAPYDAADTQGALIRFGIKTVGVYTTAAAEDSDLMTSAILDDERWMWTAQRRWVAETHGYPMFNSSGALVSTYYFINTTGPSVVEIPVDIRAKRKWEDPMQLSLHMSWIGIGAGDVPTSADCRYMLRTLWALH